MRGRGTLCPATYLAYTLRTSDVPEQAGNPADLRIRLTGTGRRSRHYSGRSRGHLPSRASTVRGGIPALRGQREDHGRSTVLELEPGHRPPTTPPPAPPRSQGRHQPKSPTAFGAVVGRAKFRHPGAAAIGNLHPDNAAAGPDRDRDRLSRIARLAKPYTITKKLAHQQDCRIPARVSRAGHTAYERAADPRPLGPPGNRHALPNRRPSHQRTRPSPPAPPWGSHRAAGWTHEDARPTQRRTSSRNTATSGARPWLSVEKPTVRTDRPASTDARPLFVRGCRNTPPYSDPR